MSAPKALKRLLIMARLEGLTLVLLICIAVPLKHAFSEPGLVRLLGPLHGIVFIVYLLALAEAVAAARLSVAATLRMAVAGIIPFGAFFNDRWISQILIRARMHEVVLAKAGLVERPSAPTPLRVRARPKRRRQ